MKVNPVAPGLGREKKYKVSERQFREDPKPGTWQPKNNKHSVAGKREEKRCSDRNKKRVVTDAQGSIQYIAFENKAHMIGNLKRQTKAMIIGVCCTTVNHNTKEGEQRRTKIIVNQT
jgi:hypothetical protein